MDLSGLVLREQFLCFSGPDPWQSFLAVDADAAGVWGLSALGLNLQNCSGTPKRGHKVSINSALATCQNVSTESEQY